LVLEASVKSRRTSSHRIDRNWIRWRRTTRSKSTGKSTLHHQFRYQCSTGQVLVAVGLLLAEEWVAVQGWAEGLESVQPSSALELVHQAEP